MERETSLASWNLPRYFEFERPWGMDCGPDLILRSGRLRILYSLHDLGQELVQSGKVT